ncbi:LysM peptidoglycan-binding domain-containing protein [Bacillus badius]|uniref:LysM domain protein n=1 Tax=Bacillus badius TaxID=1455 RepID=A0ABR5AQI8_BACBA|nr:LysM domain-containing protein [Bacillus badius]KIL72519.1 LysM domain protein [Bacillus badius]MED4718298.1 LysM peptidoglycan-binding domain-containing protein [Bacillus badius]
MARLGNIQLHIETEGDNSSVDVSSYPVEKGVPLSDHIQQKPDEFSLSGSILGPNYVRDKEYLKQEMKKGTIFTYVGRNIAKQVAILAIDGNMHAGIANGSEINIKLQTIKFASSPWKRVGTGAVVGNTGLKKPVSKTPQKAVYHVTKKGDTYWGLSKKYGVSIDQLRKWNKYPDRKIPIGVKLRVGGVDIGEGQNASLLNRGIGEGTNAGSTNRGVSA